jgi:hypothetical protein
MRTFLGVAAALAWFVGAMLLLAPGPFYAPTGMQLTPMLATVAQAHGATLLGLGVVDWLARGADRGGLIAVLGGNLVVQVLSLGVAVRTTLLTGGGGPAPAVLIHVVLGGFFAPDEGAQGLCLTVAFAGNTRLRLCRSPAGRTQGERSLRWP